MEGVRREGAGGRGKGEGGIRGGRGRGKGKGEVKGGKGALRMWLD